MPKLGMEPIRKAALVKATIYEIGESGLLDITVSKIARRAGMSPALAHHYFGSKEEIILAALRHVMGAYGAGVLQALAGATTPRGRLRAILVASFAPDSFQPEVVAAWLNFWVLAQRVAPARRLLTIYERRLQSNLLACLRPLVGVRAPDLAETIGAMIDGAYLRQALRREADGGAAALALVWGMVEREIGVGPEV